MSVKIGPDFLPWVHYKDWKAFRSFLLEFALQRPERREQLIFRGHSRASWPLVTTLDRGRRFANDEDRDRYYKRLLTEFRREAIRLPRLSVELSLGDAFDLLARHHGVPSPILDWTRSPYIASFFAFEGAVERRGESVAIYVLDRSVAEFGADDLKLIDDLELLRANHRALLQQALFTRIKTVRKPLEEILARVLTKIVLPASSRSIALADLDAMAINAASLFADLDAAARTAIHRVGDWSED